MISIGDYFLRPIAKRSLFASLAMILVFSAPGALAGEKDASKRSSKTKVIAQGTGKPVVMEFNASYCVPCRKFAPIFEKAKTTFGSKADFQSVDYESAEGEKIANKYGIASLPYILILDPKGKVVFRRNGIMDEQSFFTEVTKVIGK